MSGETPNPATLRAPTQLGLGLLAAATLLLEVALTRVLSVALWYHFAFLVVSTALFGFGFAGVALALRRHPERVTPRLIAGAALATPLSFFAGYALFNRIPVEPFALGSERIQWLWMALAYLAASLPFFCSGLAIAGILTRHARAVHRLYLFDLLGAGLGSLAVVSLLPLAGGSGTVLAAAALAGAGAALAALEAGRRWSAAAALIAVALAAAVPFAERLVPLRISRDKVGGGGVPIARILSDKRANLYTAWNTLSRTDVIDAVGGRLVLIDGGTAVTRLAKPQGAIDELGATGDAESAFVRARPGGKVLVVGSGGGREVLFAVRNGASRIVGVEINPAINHVVAERMADYTGHIYQHPKVEVVTDEARSYLRRSTERFQVIHCPHTISNAAMASGAVSLSENYLLTREAFVDYLEHLAPDGVLVITRPEPHIARLFTTARAVLEARGETEVAARLMAWKAKGPGPAFYAGFALAQRAFTQEEVAAFRAALQADQLEPLYLPGSGGEPYAALLSRPEYRSVDVGFATILEPATDDRPFFNQRVPLSKLGVRDLAGVFSRGRDARMALEDRPVAEAAIVVLLLQSAALSLLFIVLPLAVFRRRALAGAGRLRTMVAFAGLGLAYIVVEVGFLQRFSLYLGKPALVFAVVLGTLLVASGLGSALSPRVLRGRPGWFAPAAAGAMAIAMGLLAPVVVGVTLSWPEAARVAVAALLLAPAGFAMGMPFPTLVRQLEAARPERIPWAWGVNGFASVVGSVGAVLIGMGWGYTAVFACGVVAYGVAAFAAGRPLAPPG